MQSHQFMWMEVGRAQRARHSAEPQALVQAVVRFWPFEKETQSCLSPAKNLFTCCYAFFIFCHPKILLNHRSRITVGWRGVQVSTQVIGFADLCSLAASAVGLSGLSRDPQGQEEAARWRCRSPGSAAGAGTGKVREWESQLRGGEEVH